MGVGPLTPTYNSDLSGPANRLLSFQIFFWRYLTSGSGNLTVIALIYFPYAFLFMYAQENVIESTPK